MREIDRRRFPSEEDSAHDRDSVGGNRFHGQNTSARAYTRTHSLAHSGAEKTLCASDRSAEKNCASSSPGSANLRNAGRRRATRQTSRLGLPSVDCKVKDTKVHSLREDDNLRLRLPNFDLLTNRCTVSGLFLCLISFHIRSDSDPLEHSITVAN